MSEEVSLSELLDLSIGTPQERSVNFGALHALLLAMLKHQHLREIKTRWRGSSPGCGSPDAVAVSVPAGEEVQPDSELQERTASPSAPGPDSATADQLTLLSRIQTCEDGLSKSMSLILDLSSHSEQLKQQIEELRQQHEGAGDLLRTGRLVESCCHRVDVLEGTVESLRVAGLPGDRERFTADTPAHLQPGDSGADDQPPESPPPPSSHPDTPPPEDSTAAGKPSSSTQSPEAEQGLRSIGELQERLVQLEARVAAFEGPQVGPQVDPAQLAQLGELLTITGCRGDAFRNLMDELNEQRALIDRLMTDRGTMDSLEERLMGLMGPEREAASEREESEREAASEREESEREAASEREESEGRGSGELRERVQRLEEEVQQLQVKRAREERASDHQLQHQLDDLRRTLEDTISSFTSQPTSVQDEAVQRESADRSALNAGTGEKLRLLFEHYEQLQAAVNGLIQQQEGGVRAGPPQERESVQQAILQLQADCLRLSEASRFLQDESGERRRHIEELFRTTEELKLNKADKQMVESEIKADKSALEGKVSRLQFDSVTEQLSGLFHELLSKVTSQEQDWHKLMAQLSTEMQCKLNRIELDSVKKQLEERWRSIHEKLQAQAAPESEDAAGIRKQLVERFHCLSCDRPVLKHTPGPHLVTLPSFPAFPPHKSIRPFTVYTMEQLRQHYRSLQPGINRYNLQAANLVREQLERSRALMCLQTESLERQHSTTAAGVPHERISELADYGHLAAARSCGGRHNCNATGGQRRNVPQHPKQPKHHGQADGALQSEEVNIVGLDGRIYKGRLNAPAFRDPETKLPTIPSRDGVCKSKDKPAASPEVGPALHQPCSPRSRSGGADSPERLSSIAASSCSGRDWPVSALGCASQSSVTQAEPRGNEPLDL